VLGRWAVHGGVVSLHFSSGLHTCIMIFYINVYQSDVL